MMVFRKHLALAATAMSVCSSVPAFAQSSQASASTDASDIIVTARRVEEKLQDVPISITVLNQEQISNQNIVKAGDLGVYTPSLTTFNRFGLEKASFVIRGFFQDNATQPSVGVYFADVVGPRAAGSTPSGNGMGAGNFFDLQNVQVLKGPQGTLFGRNTTGGAVLLVPQKPTARLEGYVEGQLGNFDMRRVQAVLNVPLADTFKVRLGVDKLKRDGYLINDSGIGPDRFADADVFSARLSIVADLTPDLENYTIFSYSVSDNNGSAQHVVACNPASALTFFCNPLRDRLAEAGWWHVESNEPNARLKQETWQVINTTTWQASDTLTIKNIASYAEFRDISRYALSTDNYINPLTGAPGPQYIRTNNTPGYYFSSQSTLTEELQFQGESEDGRFTWQAGGYFENSDPLGFTSQMSTIVLNCPDAWNQLKAGNLAPDSIQCNSTGSISTPFQKTWFRNRGLYAQASYDLTEQLSVTGGFRYTWDKMTHRYDGTSLSFPTATTQRYICSNGIRVLNPDGSQPVVISSFADHARCEVTFTKNSNKPTWLIDLEYKPTPDVMVYAKWARGFRAGGVASANITFETWEPEKIDTYEIGAKTSFHGSSVRGYFNIAGFYNDFRNQQLSAGLQRNPRPGNPAPGAQAIVNAGKSRIWGAEIDASATFFDSLKIDIGYAYLNTKLVSIDPPVISPDVEQYYNDILVNTMEGSVLPYAPKNRLTATATYTLPLDESIGRISIGGTFVHTDRQLMSLSYPDDVLNQLGYIRSNDLVLLNASWNDIMGAPVDLSFFMTNVTNEKFPLGPTTTYTGFLGYEAQLPNEPRMWGFRLKYRFGE